MALWATFRLSYNDPNFNNILRMCRAADRADWNAVVEVAQESTVVPTRLEVLLRNLALQRLGTAGDTMFKYADGDTPYNCPRQQQLLRLMGARILYYYYGKVNYSYRWCMEDMVEYGLRPTYLNYMHRCALLNDEPALARKYADVLAAIPFYGEFTEPSRSEANAVNPADTTAIRSLMNYNDLLDGDNGLVEVYLLNSFATTNGGSREMVELSLQCCLILKDIDGFWQHFIPLLPTFGQHIPTHYQEAALLFSQLEGKYDISQLPIDPTLAERFHHLIEESSANANRGDEANAELLRPAYGDTYWYYYFFVTGLKTN